MGLGYEINMYDKRTAKNMVKLKKNTLYSYVYDNKVSHIKDEVCEENYFKVAELFG